jgi:hypothetical protein
MRKSLSSARFKRVLAGLAAGAVTTAVVATGTPALAAAVPLVLSATTGPSGGGNTITATATTAIFPSTVTPAVSFQVAACSQTWVAGATVTATAGVIVIPAANVKKLSTTKISITVPSTVALLSGQASAKFNICVYSGNTVAAAGPPAVVGSPLIGTAVYSIAAKAVITAVSPATGPALGGTQITVTGSNFPATGMTAKLGNMALSNVVVAAGGGSFTATVPAQAAGDALTLTVTTAGGSVTRANSFTYTNGIVISPNTAPSNTTVDVDVQGVGFSNLTFTPAAATTATSAHVFLVDGEYDPLEDATVSTNKANGPVAECTGILPISDTELICTLDLGGSITATGATSTTDVQDGTYTMTVVNNGGLNVTDATDTTAYDENYSQSIISSGATFTVADY